MVKTIILISICLAAIEANMCLAQSNNSQTITNWGKSVQGVQLSITLSNRIFQVGSSPTVAAVIRNSSTNDITLLDVGVNGNVLLTNNTGKSYNIVKPVTILYPTRFVTIKPGEERDESIWVTFGEDIEPGDYTLKAARTFGLNHRNFRLESNSINVKVIR